MSKTIGNISVIEISDDESTPIKSLFKQYARKKRKSNQRKTKIEEDDCVVLDFNPFQEEPKKIRALENADEELTVISECGQVACRDYPHSRHLCVKFPFSSTPHDSCCELCYCYICDTAAPCNKWKGHCHASDKDSNWKNLRKSERQILAMQTVVSVRW